MSAPNFEEINFKDYPNCFIFGTVAGSLGMLVVFISGFCIYKRWLIWRERYRKAKRLKRQKRAAPIENVLSPVIMSEHDLEPIYEDITAVDKLADTSHNYKHVVELSSVDLPPPVPAFYSNMTFSTISQDTLSDTVIDDSEAPTNIIPPYISRYDSLVTWLKNMSTGVQE